MPLDAGPERNRSMQGNEFKNNVVPIREEFEEPHKPLSGMFAESMAQLRDMKYNSYQEAETDKNELEKEIEKTRLTFWKQILDKTTNQGAEVQKFTELEAKYHRLSRLLRVTKITASREGIDLDAADTNDRDNVIEFKKAA